MQGNDWDHFPTLIAWLFQHVMAKVKAASLGVKKAEKVLRFLHQATGSNFSSDIKEFGSPGPNSARALPLVHTEGVKHNITSA